MDMNAQPSAAAGFVEFPWGYMRWFCSQAMGNTEGLTMGRMVMKPGESNRRHSHANAEEAIYVVRGRVSHELDGRTIVQEDGDFLAIPTGAIHRSTNIGEEDAEMIIAFGSGDREIADEER